LYFSLPRPSDPTDKVLYAVPEAGSGAPGSPELKFVFWQKMFTSRHDQRLWSAQLTRVLPNLGQPQPVGLARLAIYEDLEEIRKLRNRIAHHEPVFSRDLSTDLDRIVKLIALRCKITAEWMLRIQQASQLIAQRPEKLFKTLQNTPRAIPQPPTSSMSSPACNSTKR